MTHPSHIGLRAQLRNYFGRHATFSVQINIHELTNVPLVSGDFACRWRVKGAQPLPTVIRRDSTSAKSVRSDGTGSGSSASVKEKEKARKLDSEIEVQVHPPSPPLNPTRGSVSTIPSLNSGRSTPSDSDRPIGSPLLQPDDSGSLDHSSDVEGALRLSSIVAGASNSSGIHAVGPGRGRTPTVAIADHTVRWDELAEMAVPMGISKETKGLMPADLKLTVELVPSEIVKPRAALGVVRLNLAEYAGKGPVTRRYLLRESKTNATLKLTIEVNWLSGERDYIAPPLQKAQIMEGVAGLMSHDRILPSGMRTPTRLTASPAQSTTHLPPHTGPDLLAAPGLSVNRGRAASLSRTPTLSHSLSHSRSSTPQPTARTEQIIEALFNPVPTTNPNPSPFAYYAPARPPVRRGTANVSAGSSELDSSWSIIKAQQDAQARALLQPSTVVPSEEVGEGQGQDKWWKRTLGKNARKPTMAV